MSLVSAYIRPAGEFVLARLLWRVLGRDDLIPQQVRALTETGNYHFFAAGRGLAVCEVQTLWLACPDNDGYRLALPLTKKLIEDHGGQVMFNRELSVGTTFTVILPREPATAPQPALLTQSTLGML